MLIRMNTYVVQVAVQLRCLSVAVFALCLSQGCSSSEAPVKPALVGHQESSTSATTENRAEPTSNLRGFQKLASHQVKKGDSLTAIAKEHYSDSTAWPAIVLANSSTIAGPNDLSVGQVLYIPKLSSEAIQSAVREAGSIAAIRLPGSEIPAGAKAESSTLTAPDGFAWLSDYTVEPGDTLSGISKEFYADSTKWPAIVKANSETLSGPLDLQVGQVLFLPKLSSQALLRPGKRESTNGTVLPTVHVVEPGDTLFGIAERYYGNGDLVGRILQANGETTASALKLQAGREIKIPAP